MRLALKIGDRVKHKDGFIYGSGHGTVTTHESDGGRVRVEWDEGRVAYESVYRLTVVDPITALAQAAKGIKPC